MTSGAVGKSQLVKGGPIHLAQRAVSVEIVGGFYLTPVSRDGFLNLFRRCAGSVLSPLALEKFVDHDRSSSSPPSAGTGWAFITSKLVCSFTDPVLRV